MTPIDRPPVYFQDPTLSIRLVFSEISAKCTIDGAYEEPSGVWTFSQLATIIDRGIQHEVKPPLGEWSYRPDARLAIEWCLAIAAMGRWAWWHFPNAYLTRVAG